MIFEYNYRAVNLAKVASIQLVKQHDAPVWSLRVIPENATPIDVGRKHVLCSLADWNFDNEAEAKSIYRKIVAKWEIMKH